MSGTNMRFIGAVLLMGILGACGGAESTPRSGNPIEAPPIIEKVGEYSINDGSDVLDLTDAPAGSIGYRLGETENLDRQGVGLISDARKPWFFHNAPDGSVWSYVDGFGVVRWDYDAGTGWNSTMLEDLDVEIREAMPQVFANRLPEKVTP